MKQWFVRNDAIGNLQFASCSPAVWEEEVCFKLGAISLKQAAAGQFTSSMNNAPTVGREPLSSLFTATIDGHRSLETGGVKSDALITALEALKASLVCPNHLHFLFPPVAKKNPATLINRSALEAKVPLLYLQLLHPSP